MDLYDCKILLGGSRTSEVRKENISAAEIVMLRHIHGDDSVINVTHAGVSDLSEKEVRDMLIATYGPEDVDATRAGPAIMREVFGPPGVPLPVKVDGVAEQSKPKTIKRERAKRFRDLQAAEAEAAASADFMD